MAQIRKSWLVAGGMAVLALAAAVAALPSMGHGEALAPPGPHRAGDTWTAAVGNGLALVWCPPGKFLMGSPAMEKDRDPDEVQHEVTLTQGFWLGQAEVTQGQWRAVMGSTPSSFPGKLAVRKKFLQWEVPVWRSDFLVNRWWLPVEMVSWDDCQDFCRQLNKQERERLPVGYEYRLPTEAEWEYACRAGSTGPYAGTGGLDEMGWYYDNGALKTHAVAQKRPNAWGLYDMHGNVWEWCQDWGGDYATRAVTDPVGPATGESRVRRSGCWSSGWLSDAYHCRSAHRSADKPGCRRNNLGFRVALAPVPKGR